MATEEEGGGRNKPNGTNIHFINNLRQGKETNSNDISLGFSATCRENRPLFGEVCMHLKRATIKNSR
jgi:hypothetical protein